MSNTPTPRTIRLYCDGELPEDEATRVERHLRDDPQLAAAVEFERKLKDRVGSVLNAETPPVPAGLADRVRTAGADVETGRKRDGDASPLAWWRSPARPNVFAVAASLALVAGAILFGVFGRPIDTWRGDRRVDVAGEAAAAVAGEHVTCAGDPGSLDARIEYRTPERAGMELAGFLEQVPDLRAVGYEFAGGHACEVPHCDRGCHLFYVRRGDRPGLASLHIVPDRRQFRIEGDASLARLPITTDKIPENQRCRKDVLLWSHGNRCYLLVVCLAEDVRKVAEHMQEALLEDVR